MTFSRFTVKRFTTALLGGTTAAGVLFACTLTQSLDYLQKGDGGVSSVPTFEGGDERSVEAGTDAGGRVPLWQVPGQTAPDFLALDANNVYWVADNKVSSVPKATGGTPKVLGTVPPNTSALTADTDPAGFVFAAVGTDVLRFPKDGSGAAAPVTVFAPGAAATIADTIGADNTSLFVLQYDSANAGLDARILRMAKDGGGQSDISGDGGATTMSLDPTSVIWASADPAKRAFIQHAKTAPADMDMAIFALGPNDDVSTVTSSQVALDDTNLYWVTSDASSMKALIVKRKRDPIASVISIYAGSVDDTLDQLAVDDTYVYALETHGSRLLRVPKAGGDSEDLLIGLQQPTSIAVDSSGIYVSVAALGMNGQVIKIAR